MIREKSFMNYRRKQLTPDLTPLIDVVFLLLIFFMVATTFDEMKTLKIELPKSEIQKTVEKIEKVSILVDKNGIIKIKLDDENNNSIVKVKKSELKERLVNILSQSRQKNVSILADKGLEYGEIVDIMSDIKNAGAIGINIETK